MGLHDPNQLRTVRCQVTIVQNPAILRMADVGDLFRLQNSHEMQEILPQTRSES